jgi:hypothetical protein
MSKIVAPGVPGYDRRRTFQFLTVESLTETFSSKEVEADTYADALRAIKPTLPHGQKVAGLIGIKRVSPQASIF